MIKTPLIMVFQCIFPVLFRHLSDMYYIPNLQISGHHLIAYWVQYPASHDQHRYLAFACSNKRRALSTL